MERLLKILQEFEPSGVGARDLKECLLLQIQHKLSEHPNYPGLHTAQAVLTDCFEEFSRKHYEKIARKLRISDADLKVAIEEILKLNPKPGGAAGDSSFERNAEKVIPDFYFGFSRRRIAVDLEFRKFTGIEDQ